MKSKVWMVAAAALATPLTAKAQFPDIPGFPDIACPLVGDVIPTEIDAPFALALASAGGVTACVNLSGFISPIGELGKMFRLSAIGISLGGLGTVDLTATYNTDPFVTIGASTTNAVSGPVTYGFLFGTPVVPGFYTSATSTAGVSVTNGVSGTSSVTSPGLYPTYVSAYGTLGLTATNLGVDLGTAACTASGTPFTVTQTCPYGTRSNTFAPAFYDNLEALLTYNQSDLASVASWSGAVTLNAAAVPEPTTVTLMVTGVLVIAGVARNRRRSV